MQKLTRTGSSESFFLTVYPFSVCSISLAQPLTIFISYVFYARERERQ